MNGAKQCRKMNKVNEDDLGTHADVAFLEPAYTLSLSMMQVIVG